MTRKERAKQICDRCSGNKECSYTSRDLKCPQYEDIMDGYDVGQEDMLDKAVRWLLDEMFVQNVPLTEDGEPYVMSASASSIEEFINNFKKAMIQ